MWKKLNLYKKYVKYTSITHTTKRSLRACNFSQQHQHTQPSHKNPAALKTQQETEKSRAEGRFETEENRKAPMVVTSHPPNALCFSDE